MGLEESVGFRQKGQSAHDVLRPQGLVPMVYLENLEHREALVEPISET